MSLRKRALPRGWYPATAEECNREIDTFLHDFKQPEGPWHGGIVPHAGWYFSGKAAARTISTLAFSGRVDRVVLYGGHLPGTRDPVVYTEDWWETPLGPQIMDAQTASRLVSPGKGMAASRMFNDNTVEIQLPLIRRFFPDVPLIAVHAPSSVAAVRLAQNVTELLADQGLTAVHLGSADLTHYGPNYGFTPQGTGPAAVQWVKEENDRSLIDKALGMDVESLLDDARDKHNTCSAGPIAAVISSVAGLGVKKGTLLDYYTSYDIMPDSSFVGYAAIVY
jgi:MEMO1 family protein